MDIQEQGHTAIVTDTQADAAAFLTELTAEYENVKDKNIIADLSADNGLSLATLLTFLKLSNKHRKAKKSFVLVVPGFDIDEVPEEMIVVPTLQEAYDMIEMEEIERDLGF